MLAIIQTGGKQYIVSPGQQIKIEKLEQEKDQEVVFDRVLLVEKDNNVEVGSPLVDGATVKAKVIEQGKEDKKIVFKFKSKKRESKKKGHRQPFTAVEITDIAGK
tara:strand:+ start:743 stop:1057 length:315 start_codon:yes stop_codon:yes gene_type:complete